MSLSEFWWGLVYWAGIPILTIHQRTPILKIGGIAWYHTYPCRIFVILSCFKICIYILIFIWSYWEYPLSFYLIWFAKAYRPVNQLNLGWKPLCAACPSKRKEVCLEYSLRSTLIPRLLVATLVTQFWEPIPPYYISIESPSTVCSFRVYVQFKKN